MTLGDTTHRLRSEGRRKPYMVEVEPGTHQLRVAHDGPPPTYETTIEVAQDRRFWSKFCRPASGVASRSARLASAFAAVTISSSWKPTPDLDDAERDGRCRISRVR